MIRYIRDLFTIRPGTCKIFEVTKIFPLLDKTEIEYHVKKWRPIHGGWTFIAAYTRITGAERHIMHETSIIKEKML